MELIDEGVSWANRAFYFSGELASPVVAKLWQFRSETKYDRAECPEDGALDLIQQFVNCTNTRAYLLLASYIAANSAFRSKKGILWDYKELRQLRHLAFDCDCGNSKSRLVALVDLSEFGFDSSHRAILDWLNGMLVLCRNETECVREMVEGWISTDVHDVLAFDHDCVGKSLQQDPAIGVLRYFPSDNGRSEEVVVIANDGLVDDEVCECIESRVPLIRSFSGWEG